MLILASALHYKVPQLSHGPHLMHQERQEIQQCNNLFRHYLYHLKTAGYTIVLIVITSA